jgi:predicted molibdopterin-dependent oxidoreductase YjgC
LALDNGENLETLKRVWNAPIALQRGMDAMGMIRSAEGGSLKALVLLGVDPIAVFPDTDRTRRALSKLDLVVRTGMFPSRDVEIAHFVFPAVAITETDGTYVSAEGRVQRVSRITDPPGNARPTARFLLDLVGRLGPAMGFLTAKDIFDEIRSVCPGWNGLTWSDVGQPGGMLLGSIVERPPSSDRHKEGSLLVPYPPPDLFREPPAGPAGLPWKVFAEERAVHPGDGVLSGRSFRLSRFENWNCARMHPEDAAKLGARQGSVVVLRSEVGEAKARVALDPEVPRSGVVIPAGGPGYMLQSLLAWPEEYCPPGWDRIFASVALVEE